jgi:putative peptidoglycan lipid II flippase
MTTKGDSAKKSLLYTTFFNLIGKPLTLVTAALTAHYFGTSFQLDAYVWVITFITIFYGYTLSNWPLCIVPIFSKLAIKDKSYLNHFVKSILFWGYILSLVSGTALYFGAQLFVAKLTNFEPKTMTLAIQLLQLLTPFFILQSMSGINKACLESTRNFKLPALIDNIFRALIIIFMLLNFATTLQVKSLVIANIIAEGLMWIIILYKIHKAGLISYKTPPTLKKEILKDFLKLIAPLYICQLVDSTIELFSKYLLSGISVGAIAFVHYASRLTQILQNIFGIQASRVLFTEFCITYEESNKDIVLKQFQKVVKLIWFLVIPIGIYFFFFGDFIVSLLFQRGKFDIHSTQMTFLALKMLSLGLAVSCVHSFSTKLMYTFNDTVIGLYTTLPYGIIACSSYYYLATHYGFVGIAANTTLLATYSFIQMLLIIHFRYGKLELFDLFKTFFSLNISSVFICLGLRLAIQSVGITLTSSTLSLFILNMILACGFGLLYLGYNWIIKQNEIVILYSHFIKKEQQ